MKIPYSFQSLTTQRLLLDAFQLQEIEAGHVQEYFFIAQSISLKKLSE